MGKSWRTGAFLVLTASAALSLAGPPAVSQEAAPDASPGSASAIAELIRVNPAVSNLALTMRVGTALAGHQNTAANSEARSVDLGFIGNLLAEEKCDGSDPTIPPGTLPEEVLASSADPDAADGIEGGIDGVIDVVARADPSPGSSATADLVPLGLPGLGSISGGRSHAATSSDGHVATAVTEIGRMDLAGGLVVLEDLRWEATRRLLPDETSTATFEVGRLRIGGTAVPLPADDVLEELTAILEPVLGPLGIELAMPQVRELADGIELTPLSVGVVPGEQRDALLAPIFGATRDPYTQISEFLISMDCGNATYVTVLDLVIGAVSGGGFTTLDLGGVTARSSEFELTSFLPGGSLGPPPGQVPPSTDPAGTTSPTPSSAFSVDEPADATDPPSTAAPSPAGDDEVTEEALAFTPGGSTGGPLLLVGLAGLLGVAGAGIADHRRMRRAQRQVPM